MKTLNCRITCVQVIHYITTNKLCRRIGDDNALTIPSPWTPVRKERSVYVQTEVITSDVKSENELTIQENCTTVSNDKNECHYFHCHCVSGKKINESINIRGNMNKKDIVKEDAASESSMDVSYEEKFTIQNSKLSSNEEDVSNYL